MKALFPSAYKRGGVVGGRTGPGLARLSSAFLALWLATAAPGSACLAQGVPPAQTESTPPQVNELLKLLSDPAVRDWLQHQNEARSGSPQGAAPETDPPASALLAARIAAIRGHLGAIYAALPTLPEELGRAAGTVAAEFRAYGVVSVIALLAGIVALGFGAEWLFRRITAGARRWVDKMPLTSVADRLRAIAMRLGIGVSDWLVFALSSVGALVALPWPPLLRSIVLGYLGAFLGLRAALILSRFLLSPHRGPADAHGGRLRVIPMEDGAARFWHSRIALFVGWFAFGYVTIQILDMLGLPPDHRRPVAYTLGLGLLAIGIEIAWRRPIRRRPDTDMSAMHRRLTASLLSVLFVTIWLLWVARAINLFWFVVAAAALPLLIATTRRAVTHILRPAEADTAEAAPPSVAAVCVDRGLRAALIVGAVLLLADRWGVNLGEMAATDNTFTRLVRGALSATIILLIADFVWHVIKAVIDRRLAEARKPGEPNTDEARHSARVRTLLPIVRNVLLIVMITVPAMMALAALGVEVGPLIAGAGVIGVAIGFGAQTLVRDVISGMFYLLDDAFRVGEYIQSGSYKGTVESFSLRSVKLRHHRGPLYTVPFGALGAVQNMSRDWVIDKLTVGVTYDSDLDRAKKLVKQIGRELAEDPEYAADILEPLKMQGVGQFGEFAVQLQMKMMTRPGQQFTIRRRAYALIKKAFDANGIKFAFPTVQVSGEAEPAAAAARHMLDRAKKPEEAAAS